MTEPTRPTTVPADAFWSADENEWCLPEGRTADGGYDGTVRWWRPDGTLCCETLYVQGVAHGPFRRFHESGEVSRSGEHDRGDLHGTNVFFRTTAETTETFPRGLEDAVWRAEFDYEHGNIVEARAYDRQGRRCQEDGTPFPETRPDGVPQSAHYRRLERSGEYAWVDGSVRDNGDATISRVGIYRTWTPDGVLVSEEPYEDGELHGVVRRYDSVSGALEAETTYAEGRASGPALRRLSADERVEGGPCQERGHREGDEYVGVIEYLDEGGRVISSVDVGRAGDDAITQSVLEATSEFVRLSESLRAEGHVAGALLATARAVARGEAEPEGLVAALAALDRPISDDAKDERTDTAQRVCHNMQRFGAGPTRCATVLLEAIRKGARGPYLLKTAAGVFNDAGQSERALELIDAAIAVIDDDTAGRFEWIRALVRASLGDPDGARASVSAIEAVDAEQGASMRTYMRALFPDWTFWPAHDPRLPLLSAISARLCAPAIEAPTDEAVRMAVRISATRLHVHRQRLAERFGTQHWSPPDVSHLLPEGPLDLEVDHDYGGGVGIQHSARQEWMRLTYLCWAVGLDAVTLPERIELRPDLLALRLVNFAGRAMLEGHDPAEVLDGALQQVAPETPEDQRSELTARIVEAVERGMWFGTPFAELDESDSHFAMEDEASLARVLRFVQGVAADPFDDEDEDDDDEMDE